MVISGTEAVFKKCPQKLHSFNKYLLIAYRRQTTTASKIHLDSILVGFRVH